MDHIPLNEYHKQIPPKGSSVICPGVKTMRDWTDGWMDEWRDKIYTGCTGTHTHVHTLMPRYLYKANSSSVSFVALQG